MSMYALISCKFSARTLIFLYFPESDETQTPSQRGPENFSGCAELLQRYQHMVNLPSVQKCRVICPSGDFCIFILMSVFKAYETENCWEMSISNIYRLQLFLKFQQPMVPLCLYVYALFWALLFSPSSLTSFSLTEKN